MCSNHMWMILIRSGSGDGSDSTNKLVRLNRPDIGLDPLCKNCSIDSRVFLYTENGL